MAQYQVTRKCGHEETVYLEGPGDKREWRLKNVEPDRLCRACWEAEQAAKTAKAASESTDLPQLVGTEKQVAWAIKIRLSQLTATNAWIAQYLAKCHEADPSRDAEMQGKMGAMIATLTAVTSAKWWIDYRDWSGGSLLNAAQEAAK